MRNLSNNHQKIVSAITVVVLAFGMFPAETRAGQPCARWGLYWTFNDATPGIGITKGTQVNVDPRLPTEIFIPNPVAPPEEGSTETNPPDFPYYSIKSTDAKWVCDNITTPALGSTTTGKEDLGMEACVAAAKLAAKFGGFTALNLNFVEKIQTSVLNNIVGFLGKTFASSTGIDIGNVWGSILDAGGNFLQENFDLLLVNPLKEMVTKGTEEIANAAKEILKKTGIDIENSILNALKNKTGLEDFVASEVPVKDQAVVDQLKISERKADEQIAQQKIAEKNADTRVKCNELLKTTNETIKRALLYQLSTQIVDWIQTGEEPQFIKQPGKFLEDTGNLAVDRFISRVAPRLCEPFRLSVQLQIPTVRREDNPFYEQITCSLDKVVSNMENFYADFREGGWVAYNEMLKPQNNYYGASLAVLDAAAQERAAAEKTAQSGLKDGYVPIRKCTEWAKFVLYTNPSYAYQQEGMRSENEEIYIKESGAQPEEGAVAGPIAENGKPVSGFKQDPQGGLIGVKTRFWKDAYAGGVYFWECEREEITQPANIAAGLAEKATQMDVDNLVAAQDVSMFLQTIEDSIVNKLVKAGVKGLQKLLPQILPRP
ncbi:MAG: hypothetical protein V1656_01290 [Candidatus Jorgensenbacteria bacterium]